MKIIAFASDKGGMGKSTAVINLAVAASAAGFEVAILDLDPQASVGRWARVRRKADLPNRPLAETCVSIDLPDRLEELRLAGADYVFLDTAGRDNNAISSAIAVADMVITPCHPTDLEMSTLYPTLQRMRAEQKLHYILLIDWSVGASKRRADAVAAIERAGGKVADIIYSHRSDYRLAIESGRGATEYQPWQSASSEIRKVWAWMQRGLEGAIVETVKGAA